MRAYGQTNAAPYASAPAVGAAGDTYWNTTTKVLYVSDGTAWIAAGPGTGGPPSGTVPAGDLTGSYPSPTIGAGKVDATKLAVGASVPAAASAVVTPNLNFTTTETTVLTFPSITTRGGRVRILGHWATSAVATQQGSVIIRVKRDGGIIYQFIPLCGSGTSVSIPLPFPDCIDLAPSAGAHVYTVTVQSQLATISIQTGGAVAGTGFVEEAA
jgi:hypothetical protein